MDQELKRKVATAEEATQRWLAGRLNGMASELGQLRWRVEQIERAMVKRNPRPRPKRRAVAAPIDEAAPSEPTA